MIRFLKMAHDTQISSSGGSLWQIKAGLDPSCSYVVLEKKGAAGFTDFAEVFQVLEQTDGAVLGTRLHHDALASRTFLVVEIHSQLASEVKRDLLNCMLPCDIVLYFYGDIPPEDAEA